MHACFVQDVTHVISLGVVFFLCHQLNTHAFGIRTLKMGATKLPDQPCTSPHAYQMTQRQMNFLPGTQLCEALLWFIKTTAWIPAQYMFFITEN